MLKIQALVLPLVALPVCLSVYWLRQNRQEPWAKPMPAYSAADVLAIEAAADDLKVKLDKLDRFHQVMDECLEDLCSSKKDIHAAAERLLETAKTGSPEYLDGLRSAMPDSSDLERVALNLIQKLEYSLESGVYPATMSATIGKLRVEVQSPWFRQKCRPSAAPSGHFEGGPAQSILLGGMRKPIPAYRAE